MPPLPFNYLIGLLRAGGVSPWTPNRLTGAAFSATQIAPALSGTYDVISNADRIYWVADQTILSAWIKGTGATLKAPNSSPAGAIEVSVDGGAYVTCANAATVYTLFTGLSDTEHFVSVRGNSAYGTGNIYIDKTDGNIFNISGSSTYVDLPSAFAVSANTTSNYSAVGAGIANYTNHYPALTMAEALPSTVSNTGAVAVRGNFTRLFVSQTGSPDLSGSYAIWVSADGASPTRYAAIAATGNGNAMSIPVSAGTKTYYVWSSWRGNFLSVAGDAVASPILSRPQMHQFGDSITFGVADRGNVDLFRIAPSIGYVPLTLGVPGWTVSDLDTNISTWLALLPVTSNDVAVLTIGRNDTMGTWDAPRIAAYTSILNKLIAKGYGKILVRGILPNGNLSTTWAAENASIQGCITSVGDAKLIFVDTSTCPTYSSESGDNTHPTTAGYIVIADYLKPKYMTALGL